MTFESLRFVLGDPYVKGMLEEVGAKWEDFNNTEGKLTFTVFPE